jgi:hypothetical protein
MNSEEFDQFLAEIKTQSEERIDKLHHLAKRLWDYKKYNSFDVQNRCMDAWDKLGTDLECKFRPLVPASENRPVTNLIFGSGGFSTGEFQAEQYTQVMTYTDHPPVKLLGLVTNKSEAHKCNAKKVGSKFNVPVVELDFEDWYHSNINPKETKPITATRYWYTKDDPDRPNMTEITRRFRIRQEQYHRQMSEEIAKISPYPTDIASARGYNFQFCRNIFHHQTHAPHINDTHPADLTYVDPKTKERLYPGWQAGAVELMLKDKHTKFRGSLIEVGFMDTIADIEKLDEGALLAMSAGVEPIPPGAMDANQIQAAMKIIDDYFYCTLEPTGLFLFWGISDKALPVVYQDVNGKSVVVKQPLIVVGNKIHSGINAWGANLETDLKELEEFLL